MINDALLILQHGGLLIFDDYAWQPELPSQDRPQMAIDAFLRAFSAEYELLHQEYQVIVRKRMLHRGERCPQRPNSSA